MSEPPILIEARDATRAYPGARAAWWRRAEPFRAVDHVSVAIRPGETVALVGESGSGKSTLGRMMLGLTLPSAGVVLYEGRDLATFRGEAWTRFRREVQVVFQDSGASLNPRRSIGHSVEIPLRYSVKLGARATRDAADALLDRTGLPPARLRDRLPHELSGGQRQRVSIARAIATSPRVIVADEPVSALDVSVRAQILRLMRDLQQRDGLAYLFITHDLGVVRAIADRVVVLYRGAIMESGPAAMLMREPQHPYTRMLIDAIPVPDPTRVSGRLRPKPADALATGSGGCRFRGRCPRAEKICAEVEPPLALVASGVLASCHFPGDREAPRLAASRGR